MTDNTDQINSPRGIGAFFANLKVIQKIMLLAGVPTVGIFIFLFFILSDKMTTRAQAADITSLSNYIVNASNLIHELQKERGLSAVYIGSGGNSMASDLQAQVRETAAQLDFFRESLADFDADKYGLQFASALSRG